MLCQTFSLNLTYMPITISFWIFLQLGSKSSSAEAGILTPMSAEMSPISQNSPISMSPLSPGGSPLSSGINSPIASNSMLGERKPQVVMKIHSRRFRE